MIAKAGSRLTTMAADADTGDLPERHSSLTPEGMLVHALMVRLDQMSCRTTKRLLEALLVPSEETLRQLP